MMCIHMWKRCLFVTGLLLPAVATAHNYTFVEGGYLNRDRGFGDDSGLRIAGSVDLAPQFNLFGEYSDTGDLEQLTAGGQYHRPLNPRVDLTLGASLERIEVGRASDTGLGLRGGLRWHVAEGRVEVAPSIRHIDVFDGSATSLRLEGLAGIAPRLDLQGAIQGGDDDRFEAGLRYGF